MAFNHISLINKLTDTIDKFIYLTRLLFHNKKTNNT
jgi:hypothetical protein